MTITWKLETRRLKDLREHPKNPRSLTKDQSGHLKTSVEKFGLIDKPIINVDGMIVGGHQRLKVLKKLGYKEVECWVPNVELSEQDIDELNIRLNKNTGSWDMDILANQWEMEDLINWGFTEDELTGLIPEVETIESEEDGEVLEPGEDKDAKTQLGDVYELNGHRLVCGDSTLPDCVASCLGAEIPILMVTDPPYGVNYDASWRSTALNDGGKRSSGAVKNDDKVNWSLAWHLFPGSVAYVWSSDKFSRDSLQSLVDAEYELINIIVWSKQHFALSRGDYHSQHEPCWYAVKKGHQHNWQGSRKESTIWEISNLNAFGKSKEDGEERTAHSTQKPIECMARPIRNNTAKGEGIYDPFLGSGTTLIAAEQLGRICYGIELSPAYCDIIVKRWAGWMKKNGRQLTIKRNGKDISNEYLGV